MPIIGCLIGAFISYATGLDVGKQWIQKKQNHQEHNKISGCYIIEDKGYDSNKRYKNWRCWFCK